MSHRWALIVSERCLRTAILLFDKESTLQGLSGQPAMIQRALDRPPPWARSTSHEIEQMLCLSANHR